MSGADKAFGWFLVVLCVLLATLGGPWYAQMAIAGLAVGIAFLLGQERGEARR